MHGAESNIHYSTFSSLLVASDSLQESKHRCCTLKLSEAVLVHQKSGNQPEACLHWLERLHIAKVKVVIHIEEIYKALDQERQEADLDTVHQLHGRDLLRQVGSYCEVVHILTDFKFFVDQIVLLQYLLPDSIVLNLCCFFVVLNFSLHLSYF